MYEVELKLRADHDEVRHKLKSLDAERVGAVVQEDTYYDAPHRDFAETDEALRVRRESPEYGESTAYLTYKGPLIEEASKTREEAETAVADGTALVDVLAGLGFDPAAAVHKERERYRVDGYTVTLDTVKGLGEFVEVETDVDSRGEVEEARDRAEGILERLGLDPEAGIRTSYLGMVLAEDAQE